MPSSPPPHSPDPCRPPPHSVSPNIMGAPGEQTEPKNNGSDEHSVRSFIPYRGKESRLAGRKCVLEHLEVWTHECKNHKTRSLRPDSGKGRRPPSHAPPPSMAWAMSPQVALTPRALCSSLGPRSLSAGPRGPQLSTTVCRAGTSSGCPRPSPALGLQRRNNHARGGDVGGGQAGRR